MSKTNTFNVLLQHIYLGKGNDVAGSGWSETDCNNTCPEYDTVRPNGLPAALLSRNYRERYNILPFTKLQHCPLKSHNLNPKISGSNIDEVSHSERTVLVGKKYRANSSTPEITFLVTFCVFEIFTKKLP